MMPVVAAMIVPITVTDSAKPPGTRRSMIWRMWRRSAATLDFSSIVPMKTKQGIATSMGFCTAPDCPSPPQNLFTKLKKVWNDVTSSMMAIRPKISALPPRANATGRPVNSVSANDKNM